MNQDWTLTLNLTTTVQEGYNQWGTPIVSTENNITADWQLLQVYAKGNGIVVKPGVKFDTYSIGLANPSAELSAWQATSAKVFVLGYDVEGKELTFKVSDDSGASIANATWTGISFDGKSLTQLKTGVKAEMVENQKWTLPSGSFTYGTAESVPEPTTATLSLLALAGLAARRRRK